MPRILLLAGLLGCSAPPMPTVDYVDLDRFMGDWYVIAHIPASLEKNAYAAVESYKLADDGSIETTFTFREGSFDGEAKRYTPRGFVRDTKTNALWGMQFVWPIKADYRIVHLDEEYTVTIVGRQKRDYVWIMARRPVIDESTYAGLVRRVEELGYDPKLLRRVPQSE
ncbi:MAG: lipocalin family protein [Planctomycetota bacterium]|jgi:apolipoprotein D and lipocalin family protein